MKLEVVTLPVSDVDRAKSFYERLGWRFDIDLVVSDDVRTVQLTPPHSQCSIQFGKGGTAAEPGSMSARCRRRGPRASTRQGARTSRGRRSATRMATPGSCKR